MLFPYKSRGFRSGWEARDLRRCLVGAARCRALPVRYYLLAERGSGGKRMYGILVEGGGERAVIPAVAPSRRRVQALLAVMIHGRVTPTTARDVVEDWLLT